MNLNLRLVYTITAIFYCVGIHALFGQAGPLRFDRIDINSGLTHDAVTSIYQDNEGFIWISTHGGLNRYDGYQVKQFRTENGNPQSIPTNSILSIYQDSNGIFWLGTLGSGLVRFDQNQNVFTKYKPVNSAGDVQNVTMIFEDKQGFVWLATNIGLIRFDIASDQFILFPLKVSSEKEVIINDIHEGASGNLWIATSEGVWKFNRQGERLHNFLQIEAISVFEDEANKLWIGAANHLFQYDLITNQLRPFDSVNKSFKAINGWLINDIQKFGSDVWLATEQGIIVIDTHQNVVTEYKYDKDDPYSIASDVIKMFFKDRGNVLWVATNAGGVNKTNLTRKKFSHLRHEPGAPHSLSNNNVFAIEEDPFGNIWIGTIDGGLSRYNPKSKTFTHFRPEPGNASSISSAKILSLHIGPSGNLWIGTDLDGLCMAEASQLNNKTISFKRYSAANNPNALSFNVIYSVLEDHNETVWAGTWSKGLNKIQFPKKTGSRRNYNSPSITRYEYDHRNPEAISHSVIFKLFEDKSRTLWIGTAGGGLNKVKLTDNATQVDAFVAYTADPSNSSSISDNFVAAFCETKKGDFWVGTTTGLNKMDRTKGTFKVYTMKDGLPSNVIFGIQEDQSGNLWLATHAGIVKFDPEKETFRTYTAEDGLQGNVFNPDASYTRSNGEMYFGGTNGITTFFPDSIHNNPYLPKVLITDFKVFSREGKKKEYHPAASDVRNSNEIALYDDDYVFTVEFASTSYSVPSKSKYAYLLEGFDPDWIYSDADHRIATYTNLDAGTYKLRIKTANEDGVWNETPLDISVTIHPPFWQTLWFQLLVGAAIVSLLLLIYYWRLSTIRRQKRRLENLVFQRTNEILAQKEEIESQKEHIEEKNMLLENQQLHLEKLVEERTLELLRKNMELTDKNQRFEQYGFMTSHNFRGPVATLLGLCNIFNRKDLNDKENLVFIQKIEETTRKIDEMIREISSLLNQESQFEKLLVPVHLKDVIEQVKAMLSDSISASGATIIDDFHDAPLVRAVPAYITNIFHNLISNAIKFQKENTKPVIEIQSIQHDKFVMITVKDNGTGIDLKKHAAYIFHPFKRFHTNVPGKGLGLYLVKTQLKAMDGDIQVESETEKGTTFKLSLKVALGN